MIHSTSEHAAECTAHTREDSTVATENACPHARTHAGWEGEERTGRAEGAEGEGGAWEETERADGRPTPSRRAHGGRSGAEGTAEAEAEAEAEDAKGDGAGARAKGEGRTEARGAGGEDEASDGEVEGEA